MLQSRRRVLGMGFAVALLTLVSPRSTLALDGPPIPEPTAALFRQMIEQQIAAFRADNAEAAYRFASPGIQRRFPSADIFLDAVRNGYQPVHRPRAYSFGPAIASHVGPTQEVTITGPDGQPWSALYTFEQQPDGTWRISGCFLRKLGVDA
jgi:hypothetical protein